MPDELSVAELLEEILSSGRTPEEVCGNHPALLAEVELRLRRLRGVEQQLDALFPSTPASGSASGAFARHEPRSTELPRIPGYAVESVLGRGGMGVVYRARHVRLNRPVALKMLLAGAYASERERTRFTREAESVAQLRHAHIVQLYDVGDFEDRPYFTMELVEGGSLAQHLAGRPQPAREAAALLATLANAVEVAHESGIVHRDLKPSNILLTAEGAPKIADFGLAHRVDEGPALTLSGTPLGTPSYMAPEQAAGHARAVGPRTDVYALGAILYETLTGRPPFRGSSAAETQRLVLSTEPVSPSRLNSRVPRDLETICLACLHKVAERRYASAAALEADLNRFLRGEPIAARPIGAAERTWKWVQRRPTRAALLGVAAALAITALGVALRLNWQRGVVAAAVRDDVAFATEQLRASRWPEARAALERAKGRLGSAGSPDLLREVARVDRDLELVATLNDLRSQRSVVHDHGLNELAVDRRYEEAFERAGLGAPGDDALQVAKRINASPAHAALIAALDDWVLCGNEGERRAWILDVARNADPDPEWRDRVRNFAAEDDRATLVALAAVPSISRQPVSTALLLVQRLRRNGVDTAPLLRRLQADHPGDFWVQFELACALDAIGDGDAIECYRAALAIRPGSVAVLQNLGQALAVQRRFEEAFECYEQVLRIDPTSAVGLLNYAAALMMASQFELAAERAQEAIRIEPDFALAHSALGNALWRLGAYEDARVASQRALEIGLPDERTREYTVWVAADSARRLDLVARLDGIVDGSDRPSNPAEAAEFAGICVGFAKYSLAAKLYLDAFAAQPSLADEIRSGHRMSAAYAAAMLGRDDGAGADLDDAQRAMWRKRARNWLSADLELWTHTAEDGDTTTRYEVQRRVCELRNKPHLAGLREPEQLATLPEDERRECVALWHAADALLFRLENQR